MKLISGCLLSAVLAVGLTNWGNSAVHGAILHHAIVAGSDTTPSSYKVLRAKYRGRTPSAWGVNVRGVLTHVHTNEKVIFLTLDACGGGRKGNGFDAKLIAYLERMRIPATLFLSGRWIDTNPVVARSLAQNPLFDIENHGLRHKPCSVNGRSAFGISGTSGMHDVIDEVEKNADKIESLTHNRPRFYRSGTAMYDDVAAAIVKDLGCTPVGFAISGDGGATLPPAKVKARLLDASPGDIVLCHMNRPQSQTAEGIMTAIPIMRKHGYTFARLNEYSGAESTRPAGTTTF
jgi:peptidoglycan/xylan/chitin deacetylase (PgdA/CDA1 family)